MRNNLAVENVYVGNSLTKRKFFMMHKSILLSISSSVLTFVKFLMVTL